MGGAAMTAAMSDAGFKRLMIALGVRAFIDRRLFGMRKVMRCMKTQAETLQDLEFFISRIVPGLWSAAGLARLHGDFVLRRCRQPAKGLPQTIGMITGGQT